MAETGVIIGMKEAQALLDRLNGGAGALDRATVRVGTAVVYAWGLEFGRRRDGQLARRAGGARMLTRALERVRPDIAPALAAALPDGPAATLTAALRLGYRVEALAKAATPARTGNLRRSIHTTTRRG